MQKSNGITLIALIVTIIVLLIISGVSIAFLTGDNGLLSKAQSAKEESQKSSEIEKLNLKIQQLIVNKNGIAKLIDLNEFSNSSSSNYDSELTVLGQIKDSDTEAKINMDGYTFTINSTLKVAKMENLITKEIYLYKNGDMCSSVTNGWDKYVQGGGAQVTFAADKILMQTFGIEYWGHSVNTNKAISLNNYKKICLEYNSSSGYYTSAWGGNYFRFSVIDEATGSTVKTLSSSPSTSNSIIEIDISDLKGQYKVYIDGGSFVQLNILRTWIETY